jgi:hypothetical protein
MQAKKAFFLQPEWIIAILITAAAIVLHFYYWHHIGSLWRDEVNTVNLAGRHSFAEMEKDSFPILMPLLLHAWMALAGNSDLQVRFFGLLVGLGILAALWISSWKIRRAPPLVGLVLLGLNSTVVSFGDSIRAYGLGSLLAVALIASACLFVKKPCASRLAWFVLFAVLSVQVLYHDAVVVAAVCFGAWAVCWRRKNGGAALQVLLVAVISAASLLPYLENLFSAASTSVVIRTGVKHFRFFASYRDTLGFPLTGYIYVWAALALIILFCAGISLRQKPPAPAGTEDAPSKDDLSLFATVTLVLLTIGFPIFFWRAQMGMQSWYLLPFLASVVACFDAALPAFTGLMRATFFGLVTATALISIGTTGKILTRHFSDIKAYAQALTDVATPQDYIIVSPWTCGITFDHYFKGGTPWNTLPPLSDHSVHRFDLFQLQMQDTNALAPTFRQISQTLQSGHRVWILEVANGPVRIPERGTPAFASLPPPPLKYSGWSDSPYSQVWDSQTAHFIADHCVDFKEFQNPSTESYIIENATLLVASGWTNAPAH